MTQARDEKKHPVEVRSLTFKEDKFLLRKEILETPNINPVVFAYQQVKENDFFKDALDV